MKVGLLLTTHLACMELGFTGKAAVWMFAGPIHTRLCDLPASSRAHSQGKGLKPPALSASVPEGPHSSCEARGFACHLLFSFCGSALSVILS